MAADKASVLTKALDLVLDAPGVVGALGTARCKRFALVAEDGIITALHVSETEADPTGTAITLI
jgi:peroxiredoxin